MRILLSLLALILAIHMQTPAFAASEDTAEEVPLVGAKDDAETAVESALEESVEAPIAEDASTSKKNRLISKKSAETAPKAKGVDVGANYHVRAGDVLHITVWREENMDREVLVLPDGTISFPLIGTFSVEGMTAGQVQNTIKSKLRSLIPDASVTVLVKATLGNSVSVIGQVGRPGELVMNHQLSVMQALSQAGGLTPYADESEIIILRRVDGKETAIAFPYDDVIRGRNLDKNVYLIPGDVVVVPTAGLF